MTKHEREVQRFQRWFRVNACSYHSLVEGLTLQEAWDVSTNIRELVWYLNRFTRYGSKTSRFARDLAVASSLKYYGDRPTAPDQATRERALCNALRAIVPVPPAFKLRPGRRRA